jgi:hypothetical protein
MTFKEWKEETKEELRLHLEWHYRRYCLNCDLATIKPVEFKEWIDATAKGGSYKNVVPFYNDSPSYLPYGSYEWEESERVDVACYRIFDTAKALCELYKNLNKVKFGTV